MFCFATSEGDKCISLLHQPVNDEWGYPGLIMLDLPVKGCLAGQVLVAGEIPNDVLRQTCKHHVVVAVADTLEVLLNDALLRSDTPIPSKVDR